LTFIEHYCGKLYYWFVVLTYLPRKELMAMADKKPDKKKKKKDKKQKVA